MEICLSYNGVNDGISFTPILVLMLANELVKNGFEASILQTDYDPDFNGVPSDNIYSSEYQRALNIIRAVTGRTINLDNLTIDYADLPETKIVGLTTSFGCKYRCSYCPNEAMSYAKRPSNLVLEELKTICESHEYFEFFDNNVLQNDSFMDIINLIPKGVEWGALINIDDIPDAILKEMHACGCVNLYMGLETLNTDDLEYLKKPYHVKGVDPKEFILRVKKFGMNPYVFAMRGLPNEKKGEFTFMKSWLIENNIGFTIGRFHKDGKPLEEFKNVEKEYIDSFKELDAYLTKKNLFNYLAKYFYK